MPIENKSLEKMLRSTFLEQKWDNVILASAFITVPGANFLIDVLNQVKNQKGLIVTLLVGVKDSFSEPSAIQSILNYIETSANNNITIKFLVPKEQNFHVKCYCFYNKKKSKMLVGSANLTDAGLISVGELTIAIDDVSIIDGTMDYLNSFVNDSYNWCEQITAYSEHYNTEKNGSENRQVFKFVEKNKLKPVLKRKKKSIIPTISVDVKAGATVNSVGRLSREDNKLFDEIFESLKEENNYISKQFSLLYYNEEDLTPDELEGLFPIGGYYDSACVGRKNDNWEIGSKRVICKIGATYKIQDKGLAIFLISKQKDRNAYFQYTVTSEILETAEKLGVKRESALQPLNKNMLNYITLVKEITNCI